MISILTPTRGRPGRALLMAQSFLSKAHAPDDVELLFYVDEDDSQRAEYSRAHLNLRLSSPLKITVGPAWGVGRAWNDLWRRCTGDIVMMGNDDISMETPDWDTIITQAFAERDDPYWCMYGDDGINAENHCAFPIVSREWCERLNYFTPEVFQFFRHDTWVFDIAKRLERVRYIPSLKFAHHHFTRGGVDDATTKRNRSGNQGKHDSQVWSVTEKERIRHAQSLQHTIDTDLVVRTWKDEE